MKCLPVFILFMFLSQLVNATNDKKSFYVSDQIGYIVQTDSKEEAFKVPRNKSNVCHATKKRTDVFTIKNIDSLAVEINRQVFVKRKMPKGRKTKLTDQEERQLEVG